MNPLYLIAAYLLGAISFGVFVLVVMVRLHNKPPSITMNARKPVDVPCHERKYRGKETTVVVPSWEREEGVRYEFMNMTGLEDK
jgi:hypothetical protein